jgi:hypothetical protein
VPLTRWPPGAEEREVLSVISRRGSFDVVVGRPAASYLGS